MTITTTGVVARTRFAPAANLLGALGPDGFAWLRGNAGFVTSGILRVVPVREVGSALRALDVDDEVRLPGTGPIACGALPFWNPEAAALVIPRWVVGATPDKIGWLTEIVGEPANRRSLAPSRGGAPSPNQRSERSTRQASVGVAWEDSVTKVLDAIRSGIVEKVVLARERYLTTAFPLGRKAILRELAGACENAFTYSSPSAIARGTSTLLGASPELLVRRLGDTIASRPLAGSIPYGVGGVADQKQLERLRASEKDTLEHRIVVRAIVAILERDCTDVYAPANPDFECLPHVAHLATPISARLRNLTMTALDLALALHPTPAVGGAPTNIALDLISELEPFDRGLFAGPVGWVGRNGDGEWAVSIRGAEIERNRARLRAGAGIVAGSDPKSELREIEAKLRLIRHALWMGHSRH